MKILDDGGTIEEAKAVCEPEILHKIGKWKVGAQNIKSVLLAKKNKSTHEWLLLCILSMKLKSLTYRQKLFSYLSNLINLASTLFKVVKLLHVIIMCCKY